MRMNNFISDECNISVQRMWDLMEIGKRVMQLLKIWHSPYFHDRRRFFTSERKLL